MNQPLHAWKILVVDDEPDVLEVTALVFDRVQFDGLPVVVLTATSAIQAIEAFNHHPDIAVAYIDIEMETEFSGLEVVRHVRGRLANQQTRLILRTARSNSIVREQVVREFEVDDYREKTNFTAQDLGTSLVTALRTYRHLRFGD